MTGSRIRVLLVDDAPQYRSLLRIVLELDGRFEVVGEVGDGAEAVRASGAERPDFVLLDLAMPVMDGLQAIPKIHEISPETRTVVLSGFARSQLAPEALSSGASAYLEKGEAFAKIAATLVELHDGALSP